MNQYYFVAILMANIELSDEEFELLFDEAASHYDYKVKAATKVGGFLFGFQNRRRFAKDAGDPDYLVEFSENQLNLMMKALEMNRTIKAQALHNRLLHVLKDLQQQTVLVNKPLNNLKFVGHFIKD